MSRHRHADLIIAWAEDTSRVLQFRAADHRPWEDYPYPYSYPDFHPRYQWRLRPEPKPDVVRYATATNMVNIKGDKTVTFVEHITDYPIKSTNLKLTFSGEDGRLISAEVIS